MFSVGDKVVYPAHGVGRIEAIVEKEVAGEKMSFYVLSIYGKDVKIMVPTLNADKVGLRQVVREEELEKVFHILKDGIDKMPSKWNKRYLFNMDKIKTGSIYEIAEVFRNLTLLSKEKELSFGEKKMLDSTRDLIVKEIAYSKKIETSQAETLVNKYCDV
ncbi:MAG TPA: CarD family transcriptional regulator [Candidatus Limnocylindrales bacterium]|nr:CarD family transcriptional regulator [Candidatus Limnocylindrales bacterium]